MVPLSSRLRTPPLALRNVVHGGRRSLAAISGVAFSLTMVLLQLGFLEAVKITASNNFDQLDFDIVLLSPRYEQFYAAGVFPLERLTEARSVAAVVAAAPLYATFNLWRCPAFPVTRASRTRCRAVARPARAVAAGRPVPRPLQRRELFVIGIDLDKNPFREPIRARIEAAKDGFASAGSCSTSSLIPTSAGSFATSSRTGSWATTRSRSWAASPCSAASPPTPR